jgi:NADH-quinone oxidoreductase subunit H
MNLETLVNWVLNLPAWVWITLIAHFSILGVVAYLILLERKVASWVQDRIGPNRVGLGFGIIPFLKDMHMFGLGQPLADGLKFIVKEDYAAKGVDKVLFTLAPTLMIIVIIISIAVLPMGGIRELHRHVDITAPAATASDQEIMDQVKKSAGNDFYSASKIAERVTPDGRRVETWDVTYRYHFQIADLNIGALYILAVLSLAVYGVVIGGWASNNKYSFIGGLRATANMISYEIPMGLAVLCIVLMFGTLNLETIVDQQAHYWLGFIPAWNVFTQPLAFVMFLICIHAEANRAPFDLAEAEQELVGGYHTEYSSMRFALFFLAEYAGMITTSAMCVALFFGGWSIPGLDAIVVWIVNHVPVIGGGASVDPVHLSVTTSLVVCIVRSGVMFAKTIVVIFVFMWVRWSLPRFRFDQLMMLAWRALIPISLGMLIMTALVIYFFPPDPDAVMMVNGKTALALIVGNGLVLALSMGISTILPAPPATNRKSLVPGSRYLKTPLPAGVVSGGNGLPARSKGTPALAR